MSIDCYPLQLLPISKIREMNTTEIENSKTARKAQVRAEVERLLSCIKEKADHYNVLGLQRDAPIEEIRKAYCRAVEYIHPLKCKDIIEEDGAMRWKLSQVLLRVVEAFSALATPARKIEYDGSLNRRPTVPLPIPHLPKDFTSGKGTTLNSNNTVLSDAATGLAEATPNRFGLGLAFGNISSEVPEVKDRRRSKRFALQLPVRVTSPDGSWAEVTESLNVSRTGIQFLSSREVEKGTSLQVEVQMPLALRNHSYDKVIYVVRAAVRHIDPLEGEGFKIGAEFIEGA